MSENADSARDCEHDQAGDVVGDPTGLVHELRERARTHYPGNDAELFWRAAELLESLHRHIAVQDNILIGSDLRVEYE